MQCHFPSSPLDPTNIGYHEYLLLESPSSTSLLMLQIERPASYDPRGPPRVNRGVVLNLLADAPEEYMGGAGSYALESRP